ncbi:hypothetical protein MKX53_08335 [Psychrobacillus sp. FSL K6-4615]|uniref:hypothetical protein n=1 Tax=Psychrobacillus sp. FSL K6-4615 TaxID=2921551 RepID=UPI0030F81222
MNKLSKSILLKLGMVVSIVVLSVFGGFVETNKTNAYDEVNSEDIATLETALNLIFEKGIVTDKNGFTLGYDRAIFEEELNGFEDYQEIIQGMEEAGLFVEVNEKGFDDSSVITPLIVACEWHLMKEKPEFIAAENKCLLAGLKANYGPTTALSTIANLISDKEFTLAAKKIVALGIKSNIAGIAVTLGIVMYNCNQDLEKKFPGKSNCM